MSDPRPKAPPPRLPDRHYHFGRMNLVFALSALGLLATTVWMVFADYAQPWKRLQAEFRDLERRKLVSELEAERARISEQQIAQLERDIAAQEAELADDQDEIERLEDQQAGLADKLYATDTGYRITKSLLDTARYQLEAAVVREDREGAEAAREEVRKLEERLTEQKKQLEALTVETEDVAARLAELRAGVVAATERLEALRAGAETLGERVAGLEKSIDYYLLNAPLMDFVSPTIKVEQVILPALLQDINFTDVERVDRCMTCHVAANRPGFEGGEWEQPFRSHPRLDLFVADASPHPYAQFGCTVCHGGLDRATHFARAGHSPMTDEQRQAWVEEWGWERQPYLESPLLPARYAEAGCVTCHAPEVWTPASEVQDAGRELVVRMGCTGCHEINLPPFQELPDPGPDLTRIATKVEPGWAYKWLEAPRSFHPTTWMPHFFFQENIQGETNRERQQAEMVGIIAYLWERSEKGREFPAPPAGDAARGRQLFESVGCTGCHVLDAEATRDDFFPVVNRLHGPNLIRTGSKVSPGWLYAWIRDPQSVSPNTRMPDLRLTDEEAADVVAYLASSRDSAYEGLSLPAADPEVRDELVLGYLQNTQTIEQSQARLAAMGEAERDTYLGEQSIAKYGCFGCHEIAGFEETKPVGVELTEEGSKPVHQFDFGHVHDVPHTRHHWIRTKLLAPRIWDEGKERTKAYHELYKMPDFGMSEREADAVTTNVLGFTEESLLATVKAGRDARSAALAAGRRLITGYNCRGCHLIEGAGHAIRTAIEDVGMLPPNLAAEGARVQGDWLFDYLHDPGQVALRPWLTVRMPTFPFTDEEVNTAISYFTAREERPAFLSPFPRERLETRDLAVGEVVFEMLQCAKCHPAGPAAAAAVGVGAADLAPSLLLAGERLRHDWVPSWIKDPQEWVPGTRMPSNFLETTPGEYESPLVPVIDSPAYAGAKARMMAHFSSEEELKAYLADVDRVTRALRDHIWTLAGPGAFQVSAGAGR